MFLQVLTISKILVQAWMKNHNKQEVVEVDMSKTGLKDERQVPVTPQNQGFSRQRLSPGPKVSSVCAKSWKSMLERDNTATYLTLSCVT